MTDAREASGDRQARAGCEFSLSTLCSTTPPQRPSLPQTVLARPRMTWIEVWRPLQWEFRPGLRLVGDKGSDPARLTFG
jgi:hypothetical protein